jgi:threonine/homoserine/homoserine lactone efflux protein
MGEAIGAILGEAIGVAISPVPIIAVILMLFSKSAKANSLSFLVGWIIGLLGAGLIVLALGISSSDGAPSTASGVIKILIGAVFILLGIKQWRSRPKPGEQAKTPGWMSAIDDFTTAKAFGVGLVLSAVNPKNLGLTIAAAASIGSAGLSSGEEIVVLVVFVLIASVGVAAPVVMNLILGSKAEHTLNEMKEWLVANNATVMAVLFVVLGAKVLGGGISILA